MTALGARPRSASSTRSVVEQVAGLAREGASRVATRSVPEASAVASSLAAMRTSVASSVTLRATASTPPSSSDVV